MDLQCNSNQPHLLMEVVLYYRSCGGALVDSGKLVVVCWVKGLWLKALEGLLLFGCSSGLSWLWFGSSQSGVWVSVDGGSRPSAFINVLFMVQVFYDAVYTG